MDFIRSKDYPQHLRRVSSCDPETGKRLVFLTNNFTLSAATIARALQKALAGGAVFQMDQTESAHQAFLRHVRERCEDANLDGSVRLCAGGDHQKGTGPRCLALHFSTDFVRPLFRENSVWTGVFRWRDQFASRTFF